MKLINNRNIVINLPNQIFKKNEGKRVKTAHDARLHRQYKQWVMATVVLTEHPPPKKKRQKQKQSKTKTDDQ